MQRDDPALGSGSVDTCYGEAARGCPHCSVMSGRFTVVRKSQSGYGSRLPLGECIRFDALQRAAASVLYRMLTLRGRGRDGLVKRGACARYGSAERGLSMTKFGHSLKPPLEILAEWVQTN